MVIYGITIVPLEKEICAAAQDLLAPIYVDDATFDGPLDRSARLITLFLEWGPARGYFPEPAQ